MAKVYVITGASEGIGAQLAKHIAGAQGAGAALVLAARNVERLEQVADEVRKLGSQAHVIATDVTDRAACRALVDQSAKLAGGIDVLVNNAGMSAHANFADFGEEDLEWFDQLMTLNFWSCVWLSKDALPHLAQRQGQVVDVSSVAGLVGVPGRTAYCSTKWALNGFYNALRTEVAGQGVAVTLAYPGVVDTKIRQQGYGLGGQPLGMSGIKEDKAMSVEKCCDVLYRGMKARKRDIYFTAQTQIARWLAMFSPVSVDRIAMNEVKPQFRPGN